MRSIVLAEPGKFLSLEVNDPGLPASGQVLVKIHRVGICGTDFHAYRGDQPFFSYPRRLGHELGVEVLAVGEGVNRVKPGDKCTVEPYLNCGFCQACLAGKTNCCEHLKVLGVHTDGGLCDYLILPQEKLFAANDLDYEQLALVETLGIGFHAVNRAKVPSGHTILVVGAGPIGMTVMQAAKLQGLTVLAYDLSPFRLDFCKNLNLADQTILGPQTDLDQKLRQLNQGLLPQMVFDATGNLPSMQSCLHYVAFGGTIVLVGLVQAEFVFPDPLFHRKELTIMGSRNATAQEFEQIIEHLGQKRLQVRDWIGPSLSLEEVPSQFSHLLKTHTEFVKSVIRV